MYQRTSFGKLIISKDGDIYKTFHKLNIILVNGNFNILNIQHTIQKLIINGNFNDIEIFPSGKLNQIIIKGNINKIISKSPQILNISDVGSGNKEIFDEGNTQEEEKEDDDDLDSLEIQPQKYVLNSDLEEISNNSEKNEEKEDYNNIHYNNINHNNINDEIKQKIILEIVNNIYLLILNTNIATISLLDYLQKNNNSLQISSNLEQILSELIDISFQKGDIYKDSEKCAVCLVNFLENEKIKMTMCFHLFHFQCIKKWIETKIESPDCPICRRRL